MISFFESERQITKLERTGKRLWIISLSLLITFILTNAAWIIKYISHA